MQITLNGESREVAEGSNVFALLAELGAGMNRVAIERNHRVLPRAEWRETILQPGDALEIVHLVGGG